jgi:hypothetical protein
MARTNQSVLNELPKKWVTRLMSHPFLIKERVVLKRINR